MRGRDNTLPQGRQAYPAPFSEESMPFKSEAQKKKFAQMVAEGKMSQATYDKWDSETTDKKLPEKLSSTNKSQIRTVRKAK
jgi:hypothetical protein